MKQTAEEQIKENICFKIRRKKCPAGEVEPRYLPKNLNGR